MRLLYNSLESGMGMYLHIWDKRFLIPHAECRHPTPLDFSPPPLSESLFHVLVTQKILGKSQLWYFVSKEFSKYVRWNGGYPVILKIQHAKVSNIMNRWETYFVQNQQLNMMLLVLPLRIVGMVLYDGWYWVGIPRTANLCLALMINETLLSSQPVAYLIQHKMKIAANLKGTWK